MKAQDINIMMEKYYNGELTIDEERELKSVVLDNDNEEYAILRDYFRIMDEIASQELTDPEFDDRILEIISESEKKKKTIPINWRSVSTIAATVLVLISIWLFTDIINTKEVYGTINDPAIAFAQTKQALQKVSKNVNKGVKPASSTIDKVDSGIKKTENVKKASDALDNMKKINKLKEPGELLKSVTKVTVKAG